MKNWVFDLDGTLIDSHGAYYTSLRDVFSQYKVRFDDSDMQEILAISSKDRPDYFARKVGAENVENLTNILNEKIISAHNNMKTFEGIIDLLDSLRNENINIALWTARDRKSGIFALERLNLKKYFSFCVGGTCVAKCKPDPEGLLLVSKEFACDPTELIMVGDHDNDMNGAKACGAKAIRANWHPGASAQKECLISDLQFSKVGDLLNWYARSINE